MKYIRVDKHGSGGVFYMGEFDSLGDAVVDAMRDIYELWGSYQKEGSEFTVTPLFPMEGDGGYCIVVKYKHPSWTEAEKDEYYFLEKTEAQ